MENNRWPWLALAGALWMLTLGLTYITCQSKDLGAAMCAAISGQASCLVTALIVAECLLDKKLVTHRRKVAEIVAAERMDLERIAQAASVRTANNLSGLPRRPDRP